jgi:hypothetical protein
MTLVVSGCRLHTLDARGERSRNPLSERRPVWGAASSNGNGEDGRKADLMGVVV